jgi:CheY-like chemotaxis protein
VGYLLGREESRSSRGKECAVFPQTSRRDARRRFVATILLVEDDPNECLLYQRELGEQGHSVVIARDGPQALAMCEGATPDLVIMDISMPGMDGIDVMSRMLCKNNRLPIILNTAYASYKEDFRAWAADAYVVKSADLTELKRTVKRVLETRRQGAEPQPAVAKE